MFGILRYYEDDVEFSTYRQLALVLSCSCIRSISPKQPSLNLSESGAFISTTQVVYIYICLKKRKVNGKGKGQRQEHIGAFAWWANVAGVEQGRPAWWRQGHRGNRGQVIQVT